MNRREFLKNATIVGVIGSISPLAIASGKKLVGNNTVEKLLADKIAELPIGSYTTIVKTAEHTYIITTETGCIATPYIPKKKGA